MTAESLREKAAAELRQFIILSIYLWICFAAILFYKSTVLRAAGIAFVPLGFAGIKAAVSAKFIMIADFLPIAARRAGERLLVSMLRKSLVLLILLAALTLIEEGVIAMIHGQPLSEAVLGLGGTSPYQIAASLLLMLLILIPYVGFGAMADALGVDNLPGLMLQRAGTEIARSGKKRPPVDPVSTR
jgi:hypothetical protein